MSATKSRSNARPSASSSVGRDVSIDEQFLTAEQFAEKLSLSVRTIRERQARGEVVFVRLGGAVRYPWLRNQALMLGGAS